MIMHVHEENESLISCSLCKWSQELTFCFKFCIQMYSKLLKYLNTNGNVHLLVLKLLEANLGTLIARGTLLIYSKVIQ